MYIFLLQFLSKGHDDIFFKFLCGFFKAISILYIFITLCILCSSSNYRFYNNDVAEIDSSVLSQFCSPIQVLWNKHFGKFLNIKFYVFLGLNFFCSLKHVKSTALLMYILVFLCIQYKFPQSSTCFEDQTLHLYFVPIMLLNNINWGKCDSFLKHYCHVFIRQKVFVIYIYIALV